MDPWSYVLMPHRLISEDAFGLLMCVASGSLSQKCRLSQTTCRSINGR